MNHEYQRHPERSEAKPRDLLMCGFPMNRSLHYAALSAASVGMTRVE
jgi:hypothetical protein